MTALFHVAQVVPREEPQVCLNIRQKLGFEVFHPTKVVERRQRHRGWGQEAVPLIPGYLFVRFDPRIKRGQPGDWRPICSARGVTRLLGPGPESPKSIPNCIMSDFMERHAAGEFQDPVVRGVLVGERARVLTGSFAGQDGQCDANTGKKAALWLQLFGGAIRVWFPLEDLVTA